MFFQDEFSYKDIDELKLTNETTFIIILYNQKSIWPKWYFYIIWTVQFGSFIEIYFH